MNTCPKCGAEALRSGVNYGSEHHSYTDWACGSYQHGERPFEQGIRCRVAELEAENARLKATVNTLAGGVEYLRKQMQDKLSTFPPGGIDQLMLATIGAMSKALDAHKEQPKQPRKRG